MSSEDFDLEEVITRVISYQGEGDSRYIDKFNKDKIVKMIEDQANMEDLQKQINQYGAGGLDLVLFIRVFLCTVKHDRDETLYLAIALMDLFKDICETYGLHQRVKSSDVLNYILEVSFHLHSVHLRIFRAMSTTINQPIKLQQRNYQSKKHF